MVKRFCLISFKLIIVVIGLVMLINFYVVISVKNQMIDISNYEDLSSIDCIFVLGAGVRNGGPSPLLEDRLKTAIELYKLGVAKKIIMSGDHGRKVYDEVNTMKEYAINHGVPSENIFMDHAGFSTYESIYRAKEIFKVKKMVVVTQNYHLYRSLYISNGFNIEAYGVAPVAKKYSLAIYREVREVLARNKDFIKCIFKPEPTYLGEAIPISGDGNITNDK